MQIVRQLDAQVWKQFVDDHPQGNVFHTPEMFQVFARTKGHHPTLWAAVNDQGQVQALFLPVLVTVMGGPLHRLTTRAIAYGGVLCAPEPEGPAALATLLRAYTRTIRHQALFTELRHLTDVSALQPILAASGFTYEEHLDYIIDLDRPTEEVWRGITRSGRKSIRRSKARGVTAEEVRDRSQLLVHYDLIRQTYERAGIPLADISMFEAVFDVLVPRGMAKMFLAQVSGCYAASSVEVPYKDVIYSWYSGYDRAFHKFTPNDNLVWQILEWGIQHGYRCFDFGGAGRPGEAYGARDFKAKFGGRLVNLGRHTCVHAPLALVGSRIGYQAYRKIRQYLARRKEESPAEEPDFDSSD
jgi:lipid II:glycine glycyltransferase (peptidoglycan interpeptide bridge formation enzyme)